ncbi:hypothetical protein BDW59DRAFT_163687 [Aspergillus cavernicola]|uniref:Uncharacterized protein n=1 Tax=Aspergillus cavernicola TaxID=176166 RepID=A0ABR4I5Y6_9EURO
MSQCTTQSTLCDQCLIQYGKISRNISSCCLVAPTGSHAAILECEFTGTKLEAYELARSLATRLTSMAGKAVTLYASIRRKASGEETSQRHWEDVRNALAARPRAVYSNGGWVRPSPKSSGLRQLSILVDMPVEPPHNKSFIDALPLSLPRSCTLVSAVHAGFSAASASQWL